MALHKASSVPPVSGCAFPPSRKSGRWPAGLSCGSRSPQLCVCYPSRAGCSGSRCQDRPRVQALALVCFLNLGVLVMGGDNTFSFSDVKKLYS